MENPHTWYVQKLVKRTVKALEANYFKASSFEDRESLVNTVTDLVRPKMVIGFGGSVTIREIGLKEKLQGLDVTFLDHWKDGLTTEQMQDIRIRQLTSDIFITGSNAITERGEIVNIDGVGNRVNGITFGPKKVIIIVGYNKIVPDVTSAIDRIKRISAPMNAKRLNFKLPCAETGYCHNCNSELRICRVTSILERKPNASDISIFILNESIGY